MKLPVMTILAVGLVAGLLVVAVPPLGAETLGSRKSGQGWKAFFMGEDNSFRDSRHLPLEEEVSSEDDY